MHTATSAYEIPRSQDILPSRCVAPALVSNREDLEIYYVEDASSAKDGEGPKGYAERFIHSELYKMYLQGVKNVVDSQ